MLATSRRAHSTNFNNMTRSRRLTAFSLVEVLVSIFIAMLIIGIAVLSIGAVNEEARIRRVGSLLEATARTALQESVKTQRDHWIGFSRDSFAVLPEGKPFELPHDGNIELRHWGEKTWQSADDARWRFSSEGLCEPLQVRFTLGGATLELQFDPLTGAVADESMIVDKG